MRTPKIKNNTKGWRRRLDGLSAIANTEIANNRRTFIERIASASSIFTNRISQIRESLLSRLFVLGHTIPTIQALEDDDISETSSLIEDGYSDNSPRKLTNIFNSQDNVEIEDIAHSEPHDDFSLGNISDDITKFHGKRADSSTQIQNTSPNISAISNPSAYNYNVPTQTITAINNNELDRDSNNSLLNEIVFAEPRHTNNFNNLELQITELPTDSNTNSNTTLNNTATIPHNNLRTPKLKQSKNNPTYNDTNHKGIITSELLYDKEGKRRYIDRSENEEYIATYLQKMEYDDTNAKQMNSEDTISTTQYSVAPSVIERETENSVLPTHRPLRASLSSLEDIIIGHEDRSALNSILGEQNNVSDIDNTQEDITNNINVNIVCNRSLDTELIASELEKLLLDTNNYK